MDSTEPKLMGLDLKSSLYVIFLMYLEEWYFILFLDPIS